MVVFLFGGGKGIRTLVGLRPNGFHDRLVMTASISLHIKPPAAVVLYYHIFREMSTDNSLFKASPPYR